MSTNKETRENKMSNEQVNNADNALSVISVISKPRGSNLTEAEIEEAYIKLHSNGQIPSVRNVLKALGRGSITTIHHKVKELNSIYLKAEIDKALEHDGADAYIELLSRNIALQAYNIQINAYEAKIKSLSETMSKSQEVYTTRIDELEAQNEEQQIKIKEQFIAIQKLEQELAKNKQSQQELEKLNSELRQRVEIGDKYLSKIEKSIASLNVATSEHSPKTQD